MSHLASSFSRKSTRGSLLVVTLWMITILSILAVAIGRYLSIEVRLTKYRLAREQAQALAHSGVYLAQQRLADDIDQDAPIHDTYDWLGDDWAVVSGNDSTDPSPWIVQVSAASSLPGRAAIRITDEERKMNLNTMKFDAQDPPTDPFFTGLISLVGSAELATRIVDYIDADETRADDPSGQAPENDSSTQPPYVAKNASLVAYEELWDIPGMTEEAFTALREHTSIHYPKETAKLNLNTVEPTVLVTLGFPSDKIEALKRCREEGDVFDDTQNLVPKAGQCMAGLETREENILRNNFGIESHAFTVVSEGIVSLSRGRTPPTEVHVRVDAVIQRKECPEGLPSPCILAWREGTT